MNNYSSEKTLHLTSAEKRSAKLLMEKMGLSKKELREINGKYGVSSAKLLERMQLSKYQFVHTEEDRGYCAPCNPVSGISIERFRSC